jgi:hypothetical protein
MQSLNDSAGNMQERYPLSKLLVFDGIQELARRCPVEESNVVLSVLTPGMCKSSLFRDEPSLAFIIFMGLASAMFARTTEQGSRTLVYGVDPDLPLQTHGRFLLDNKIVEYVAYKKRPIDTANVEQQRQQCRRREGSRA